MYYKSCSNDLSIFITLTCSMQYQYKWLSGVLVLMPCYNSQICEISTCTWFEKTAIFDPQVSSNDLKILYSVSESVCWFYSIRCPRFLYQFFNVPKNFLAFTSCTWACYPHDKPPYLGDTDYWVRSSALKRSGHTISSQQHCYLSVGIVHCTF